MNKVNDIYSRTYMDWAIGLRLAPEFVRPIVSDCSIPEYLQDPVYSDTNVFKCIPKTMASYRCYLLACLEALNELYWAHSHGEDCFSVVARSLDNCFALGQCWRYISPLIEAAVSDLPDTVGDNLGDEDAWDWVDAAFQEGLRSGHIYSLEAYHLHASAVCKVLASPFFGGCAGSLSGLYKVEGLEAGCSRIDAIVVLEIARHLTITGKKVASQSMLEFFSGDESSVLRGCSQKEVYSQLVDRGVDAAFGSLTEASQSDTRRASGAISSSLFRTLNRR